MIAAIGKNNELGLDNSLIWHLPNDLQFFKHQTLNKKIIMGYNTFLSLHGLLPKREHIVLTSHKIANDKVQTFNNFDSLFLYLQSLDEETFIIGGASLYKLFLQYAKELILTEIDATTKADVFFPEFDRTLYSKEILDSQTENDINYKHVRYLKK